MEFKFEIKMLRDKDVESSDGNKHWFHIGEILNFKEYQDTFDYCIEHALVSDCNKFPSRTLGELYRVVNEKPLIHYLLEEEQDLDNELNIFIRVNSGGTILIYSDMLLSIATAQWQDKDDRSEIYGLVDDLIDMGEGFDFDKDFILKASLVLIDIPAIEFRVNNFKRENMLLIEQKWEAIERALRLTVKLLVSWGYSRQTLV